MSGAASTLAARLRAGLAAHRTALTAVGAVGFGLLAAYGARSYIGERLEIERARLVPRHETVELVVARRDLRRGEAVGPDTMAVRTVPRDYALGAAIAPGGFDAVSGARLAVPMKAGEPLLPTALVHPDTGAISSRVRPGVRAMTIAVDEVNSLSGMLQPGDRIDLLLSVRPAPVAGMVQPEVTRTVMQGVAVMATGRQSRAEDGPPGRPFTSITVEVDPEQAQRLVVAQRSGKLTAVLRNPEDRSPVTDRRLDVNALLGLPPPAAPPAPVTAAPRPVSEVIVGGRGLVGAPRAGEAG
ncbi:MAG TPA: Flp pilus assembly protein CpaB, partial [Burkholderiaceae bacterium]|nr:Flp pilus assembly protein CpaB [Burkholderiaceae bacterium]